MDMCEWVQRGQIDISDQGGGTSYLSSKPGEWQTGWEAGSTGSQGYYCTARY